MASLVAPLVSGIAGAASGTAEFYLRGTSTLATGYVYADKDAQTAVTTTALDAHGGATRYVTAPVDVIARDSAGASVRTFTWEDDARAVSVYNAGWTGTSPTTGSTVAGGRTTLDAALSLLHTSLGTTDGKVLVQGTGEYLKDVIDRVVLARIYDVTADRYGAEGNGTTNDQPAIQRAIAAAAAAGGGTVYFPPGDYRITEALDLSIANGAKVNLIGAGPDLTYLANDDATEHWINVTNAGPTYGYTTIAGIRFRAIQSTTGSNLRDTAGDWKNYRIINCHFGANVGTAVLVSGTVVPTLIFESCKFTVSSTDAACRAFACGTTTVTGTVTFDKCTFFGVAGSHTPTTGLISGAGFNIRGCYFDMSATTGGSGNCIALTSQTGSIVIGNRFNFGSAAAFAISVGSTYASTETMWEDGNTIEGSAFGYVAPAIGADQETRVHLGSRMGRCQFFDVATGASPAVNMTHYGKCLVNVTNGGVGTVTISPFSGATSDAPSGSTWDLILYNTSGGTITVAFGGAATTWKVAAVAATNNNAVGYRFFRAGTRWIQQGASVVAA